MKIQYMTEEQFKEIYKIELNAVASNSDKGVMVGAKVINKETGDLVWTGAERLDRIFSEIKFQFNVIQYENANKQRSK